MYSAIFTEHPSDVDIELENNMGYGVNEQGQSNLMSELYNNIIEFRH